MGLFGAKDVTGVHESRLNALSSTLNSYWQRIKTEPQFNPVKQLAFELSRDLEVGNLSLADMEAMIKVLSDRALLSRAREARGYIGGDLLQTGAAVEAYRAFVRGVIAGSENTGQTLSFAAFKQMFERPQFGVVFTAHPTFAMSSELRRLLVDLIETPDLASDADFQKRLSLVPHRPDGEITLASEQAEAQSALRFSAEARRALHQVLLEEARDHYPDDWVDFTPNILTLNSWVGYDLDGRTDIRWNNSLQFRLIEKRAQLSRHLREIVDVAAQLEAGPAAVLQALKAGRDLINEELSGLDRAIDLFSKDLSEAADVSAAANFLTQLKSPLGASLAPLLEKLNDALKAAADDDMRLTLKSLCTTVQAGGLTTSRIHIRINAMQVHNAIRKPMGERLHELNSLVNLTTLDQMILEEPKETVNFACLALERSTAIRQFIVIAQILKFIDGDAPIRLLIAECEHAFTVLSALYFAKMFDIEDRVDISPLFETERAMERGADIIQSLLKFQSYRDYIQRRGRLSIQAGFSDAGRFFGQVPAAMAIENLQSRIAAIVAEAGLDDIEVLFFNTHGESMGRGAHPLSLKARFDYLLSPVVRHGFQENGLSLHHEVSFQGGDGYVFYGSERLATATLATFLMSGKVDEGAGKDLLYKHADFKEDLFERLKLYQSKLFENANYQTSLGALETNLLFTTGSRKTKRQFDGAKDNRVAAAKMRAIPHNALLQQFGFLANVISGFGTALHTDKEQFAKIYHGSERLESFVAMINKARQHSSVKTLVAYATIFNDAFWVTRPIEDMEVPLKDPCLMLADLLREDERHDRLMHFATYLRKDDIFLHDLFTLVGMEEWQSQADGHERDEIVETDLLHAIRIALIMHVYLLAARLPVLAARNDVTHKDIMNMVLSLRIEDAMVVLHDAYPRALPGRGDYTVDEPASYMEDEGADFEELNDTLIDPMLQAYELIRRVGVGLGHHYRAHG